MEDIEYLDEYKDLVLPGIKSGATPSSSAGVSRQRRISSDSSNSSSIDADIFQKLFHGKYLDEELLNEGSVSKSQVRGRRRSPSSSSSDDSNDALEALFSRKSGKSKPNRRRERYESFDSVDDLGEALMRPSHRSTVSKPSTSQAGARKSSHGAAQRRRSSNSSGSTYGNSKPLSASQNKSAANPSLSARSKNSDPVVTKSSGSVNGSGLASSKNKSVTIIKAQKTDLTPSQHEPKTDPLTLGEYYGDSDSDSSYEFESDFYGDRDSEDEDAEPVIDISTDTSRTTSVADTVTPVVSDDEGQEPQSEQNEHTERPENDRESVLRGAYERLQSYLSNLSCAEAPPIYKKQSSARKSRSNEKKSSTSEQVKHANEQSTASDKEEAEDKKTEREQEQEAPGASSSAKSSASKTSTNKKLYDVDDSVTLETVERMSLNLAEQIMEIDVERSYEFEKRSGSKTRSRSRSKVSSNLSKSHVRKLTYSSERLDNPESSGTQLRRSKSDSFPKRGRGRSQKKRINRAATTEEKTPNAQEGVGEIVKRKRGRPRKNAPKQEMAQARVTENADESLEQNKAELMKASEADATMETGNSEEQESLKLDSEQDKTKEFAGSENVSQNDTNMTSCHHEKHLKGAPDRDVQLDKEPFENLEEESPPTLDTLTKTSDAVEVCNDITENIENIQDLDEKDSIPEKLELQKGSAVEDLLESNDHTIKNLDQTQNEIEATEDIELPSVLTNVDATGNILEQSDSQLAEDIKLAEEILAAEVGKGIEVSEVSVASVEGGQNPVTEIVKELEQETISEVVEVAKDSVQSEEISLAEEKSLPGEPTSSDDQPPAENQDLVEQPTPVEEKPQAENQNLVGKPTPVKKQTKVEEEPLVEKQTLVKNPVSVEELTLPDKDPPAKDPSPARARSHVQELDSVSKDQPATKEQNLSSPAITPKKLKELEAHESSVSRRALRSDKPSPVKESRPKRPRRTQLALLICDSSRRNSPRLGRSPAESHSSQERSPMENKGAIKFAKEQLTTEKEKEVEEKALPIETDCKEGRDTKATKIEPEIEKVTDSPLKSEKSQMILGTESDKDNLDSIEELPPTSKPAEEYSTSSESEQKDEKLSLETEPAKEKTSNSRKSRRTLLGKVKSECETSEKKPLRTGSKETDLQSETTQSNSLADKEERTSGRLSRRDKAMADAAKPQKDKLPSAKSKSSSKTVISKEKNETKEKDEIKETESDDKASLGKSKTDKKTEQEKSDSDKQANVGSNQKEPKKKGSSRARSKKTIQELTTKSEAVALITDPEAITNKSVQESAEVSVEVIKNRNITDDQKPNEEITETNKEESIMPKIEAVQNTSSAEQDSKVIGKDTSQYFADVFQDISQKSGKTDDEKPNENTTETTYEESLGLNTESVQIPSSSEKVLEPIPTVSAQASDKSNVLKNKSKLRSKKGNTKFKEKISDSDEKEEKVPVQERSSAEKDPVENSQTETADLEHKQDSESTPKGTTQDSDKSNAFKEKPKPRSKKGNKKSKEKISEPDEKEEKDSVQKTNSTENDSVEKSEAETEELKVKPESPVLERARIRKRRQAVVIEDIEPHKDENRVDSSDPQTPASIINEPSLPILEALENVSETSESKVTPLKGKSKTKKGKLSVAAPDHEETTGSLELTHELKEQSVSAHTSIENKETISSPADSQIALPTTPTSSIDQTKNTGSTLKGSSKSKLNVPKLAHKSDKATQRTPKLGSESLTSANQRLLSTPSVSCRNLRVLVKRTPNSFKGTRRSSVFKKTPTKTKRLKALMDGIQKSPSPKRRASEQSISTVATESESIHDQDLLPGSESEPNQNLNNEVPNETPEKVDGGTRDEPKEKEESDQEQETNDKETSDEVDTLIKKGSTENILKEGANALVHESSSLTEANSELHAIKDESPKEENSEEEISKEHSQKEETQEEQSPHDQKPESESAPATDPGGEEPTVKSVAAESETDVTDDEEPAKSPIPDSTETTSVTVEPQPSTSSMLKRSLRKRDADSSQPDEAAKRKQRQMVEKSVTDRQELGKPNRRRHLVEDEERPTNKRTKIASHEKTNVKGKYISIIGNETIMSSTTAPIKEGERTSGGKEINKNVELGPPVRKLLKTDSSSPGGKKPMVQTLLSSTLSLQKPSSGEDGSALTPAKSQKRADAKDKADDQPVLNSSILLTKKSLSANKKTESSKEDGSTAAPRKVNISVSLLPSKGTTAEASKATVSTPVTSPILPRKAQPEAQKMARKSEPHKKAESKNKEAPSEAPKSEVAAGTSKKSVPSALTGRKPIPLPQLELSKKIESRRSDGILPQSSSRKTAPQLDRSKKMLARKSEGAALGANVRKQPIPHPEALKKTETKKPEAPAKAVEPAENDKTVEAEEAQTVVRGRGVTKKTKSEQRMFRSKTGLPTSEAETTSDSRDSSRDDSARSSDKPVPVAPRQVIHSKSVHMTRAASSNRSLAPTPVPTPGRQRNVPKELLTSATDQKRPIQPARTLEQSTRGGAPGGRSRQPAVKRKTVDPLEEDAEVVNPKRPKELLKEDLQQKEDPIRGSAAVAFPVKITVADLSSSADSLAASPMGKADQPKSKIRKVRVRINRQVFTKFLREQQEKIEEINTVSQKLPSPPPPQDATSETDSAAESRSETKLQSQTEPAIVLKPVPASQLLSQPVPNPAPTPASELPVRKSSNQLEPKPVHVPSAAPDPTPAAKPQPELPPAKTTVKTAIYPLTGPQLPDVAKSQENAIKLAEQKRVQMFHAKSMPLPVPIPEVKSEPEDSPPEVMDEGPLLVPLPEVAAAPVPPQPQSVIEDTGAATFQINTTAASFSSGPSVSHSIPSASAPSSNPNAIGQTKMFSFLYPNRYKRSYDDVGLDFCCPNLDGPMRAIDFTRLHSKAEVPVLELPQFLVITTKFISKADKDIPSKVRAKLELLGKSKERDSSEPIVSTTAVASGEDAAASAYASVPAAPTPTIIAQGGPPAPLTGLPPTAVPPTPASTILTPGFSANSTPAVDSSNLDSLTNMLPRGTTLTKKVLNPGAPVPPTASASMLASLPPAFIQMPPICPTDKQRMELQSRVQVLDLVLQALSRRVATLTLAERQRTIEEMVKTSSLMAIDVDVGTKLLENYMNYLNKATSTTTTIPPISHNPVVMPSTSVAASAANAITPTAPSSSSLSKSIVSTTTITSSASPRTKKTAQSVQQRSSLPASIPLFDPEQNIIGFQCPTVRAPVAPPAAVRKTSPAVPSTPVRASTSSAAAAATKGQHRSTSAGNKSAGANPNQFVNMKSAMSINMAAPRVNKKKQEQSGTTLTLNPLVPGDKYVLCKKKTTPIRTATQPKTTASPAMKIPPTPAPPSGTADTAPDETIVTPPVGMSLTSTSNPNVFLINQVSQPEESILPDLNHPVAPLEAEIKGELDDSSEAII